MSTGPIQAGQSREGASDRVRDPTGTTLPGLVFTKLYPPALRDATLARDRLLDRLRQPQGSRLTVVVAPAGYGKTTLLGTWHEAESAQRPVAWLSLDNADDDPIVLWAHALEALCLRCPALDPSISAELLAGAPLDLVLLRLANQLTEQGDAALVLDDFHRLSNGAARDSIAWLAAHAPRSFRLVVSSRSEPTLPLAVLRARGELIELRAEELGFTSEEANALLNERLKLRLSREDIEVLVERTEGWPAGLYLAALSLDGVDDRHSFVNRFGGDSRNVVDFLIEEVLEPETDDPAMQELTLRCSILERLCGPLCDAVLEREDCGEMLERLSRTNLFLVHLDDRREWYRFHHLFAQVLRVELERREPGLTPALHRRAYLWHRNFGLLDEAIRHAIEAAAYTEASELIARSWIDFVQAARYHTVLAWLGRFPEDVVREDTRLLLVKAWVLSACARRDEAEEVVAIVERLGGLERGPLPDGFSSPEASLATLRATLPWGDVGLGLANARRAAELEAPGSRFQPEICWALGMGRYFSGHVEEAAGFYAEAAALAVASEHWLVAASSLGYGSLVAGERGYLEDQSRIAEEGMELVRARGLEDVNGEVQVAMGVFLAAVGRAADAPPLFERGVVALRVFGQPIELLNGLIHQATVLEALGEGKGAAAAIAEARTVIDSCPDPGILVNRLAALDAPPTPRTERGAELTERELTVLRMLNAPLSERDIGRELYLSPSTVHSHVKSIYRKLGVSSRNEALVQAHEQHLL